MLLRHIWTFGWVGLRRVNGGGLLAGEASSARPRALCIGPEGSLDSESADRFTVSLRGEADAKMSLPFDCAIILPASPWGMYQAKNG